VVVVPARLHPMKGHVDLLAAMPALRARVPDVVVLCAGTGPLARVLPALAAAAGQADAVRFVGPWDDMPLLYGAADVVALPSRVEGLPSAMLEAWAALRPVVAPAVGGVPEAVVDGVHGRCVPSRDPAALAMHGRALVLERFRAEPAARAFEAIHARWGDAARRGSAAARGGAGAPDTADAPRAVAVPDAAVARDVTASPLAAVAPRAVAMPDATGAPDVAAAPLAAAAPGAAPPR
jgi:glycosyltransferase involved in cell wall biosynthesis